MSRKIKVTNIADLITARRTKGAAFSRTDYKEYRQGVLNRVQADLEQMSREDFERKYVDWLYGVTF